MYKDASDLSLGEFAKRDIDLTNETKALLLFKKFIEDVNYRDLCIKKFKYKYYSEFPISIALAICIKYLRKYEKLPDISTLKNIIMQSVKATDKFDAKTVCTDIDSAVNLPINADEEFIRDTLINFIAQYNTYNIILDNIERIQRQKDVSYLLQELQEIDNLKLLQDNIGMKYFADMELHLNDLTNPEQRLSTGFNKLDKFLNGGWLKEGKMLGIFMAASHVGKSLMLANLAVNSLKQGKFAVIISLEMSEHVYAQRIDSVLNGMDINRLQFESDKLREKITDFKKLHPKAELVIKEFAANTITARNLKDYLKKLEVNMQRKIDVVYLDYLTLIAPIYGKDKNTYERGASVAIDVRAISYDLNCPIITAVQGNRSTFNNENIGMESVAESIAIAQTADVMISMIQTDSMLVNNLIVCEISKNRLGGRIGEQVVFNVNYNSLALSESESKEDKNSNENKQVKKAIQNIEDEFEGI